MGFSFLPHLLPLVLNGTKTQTRRLARPDDQLVISSVLGTYVLRKTKNGQSRIQWCVGREYAIQPGRGKEAVAYRRLIDIRREDVRYISDSDAVAEGFLTRERFWETWCSLNDKQVQFVETPGPIMYAGLKSDWKQGDPWGCHDALWDGLKTRPAEKYDGWAFTFEAVQS